MKKAPWIIIATLLIVIFLQREWLSPREHFHAPETFYDTIHDTLPYPVIHYVPKLIYQDTGSTRWRWQKVDTTAILKDYFSRHYYADTLANDTNALIIVYDTISRNKIISRKPVLKIFTHLIKQTTVIKSPVLSKRKIFAGIGVGRNPNQFGLSASILYVSRKDNAYSFSYDLLNHDFYFSMYWKIRFHK